MRTTAGRAGPPRTFGRGSQFGTRARVVPSRRFGRAASGVTSVTSPQPAVEIHGLSKSFGAVRVLEDVHLDVAERDFLAIIGPNGAGKTVLLRILLGLLEPDAGSVRVFGAPIDERRGRIGYVPQHAGFDRDFPIRVLDVVLLGRMAWKRQNGGKRPSRTDREIALEALESVQLADRRDRQIGQLSGGQLQRVLIARALAMDADLLLLDEPTAHLDSQTAAKLYELMARLSTSRTVILVSHDVGVLSSYVRSIACLNRTLHYHPGSEVTPEMIEHMYGRSFDIVRHAGEHGHERWLEDPS